ncbi:hypothetical protein SAMN06272738_5762 [Bacillus sp. JKS001846]|nr:hypothetical protein SAMN06272738_5762 [Bacillus sp. JKS001846]
MTSNFNMDYSYYERSAEILEYKLLQHVQNQGYH